MGAARYDARSAAADFRSLPRETALACAPARAGAGSWSQGSSWRAARTENRRRYVARNARGRAGAGERPAARPAPMPPFCSAWGPITPAARMRRVFRPGFFSKVSRTSVLEHYGCARCCTARCCRDRTSARRAGAQMRARARCRLRGRHPLLRPRQLAGLRAPVAVPTGPRAQMRRRSERFREVFAAAPRVHGAAGWQMNDTALALEEELGFSYASDTRGDPPFVPLICRSTQPRARSCPPRCQRSMN